MKLLKTKIGSLGRVVTGKTPPTANRDLYGDNYLFVTPTDLLDKTYFIYNTKQNVSELGKQKHKNQVLPPNSIMYTCIASVGKIGLNKDECLTNQQINSIIPSPSFDFKYIYYKLIDITPSIQSIAFGGGVATPIINKSKFEAIDIEVPPLSTQRKIASILSAYDDLIENNLKRIKLLEESIRTHYKIMMSENDGSWEKQRIDEAYDFSNGYAFYKDGYSEDGNIVIDLGNISESSNLIMTGKEKYVSELLYDDKKKFHLNKYDVIVAMTDMTSRLGILAKVALIDESNKYILNQRVGRLRSKIDYIDHCFVYASLSNEEFRNEMKTKAKGAVQIYFNTKDILEYEVTIPPQKEVQAFSKIIKPIIDLRFSLNNQNTKLQEARDILLPKLMNGQIEV
jgi:type I restriction enzyme S subunit